MDFVVNLPRASRALLATRRWTLRSSVKRIPQRADKALWKVVQAAAQDWTLPRVNRILGRATQSLRGKAWLSLPRAEGLRAEFYRPLLTFSRVQDVPFLRRAMVALR